MTGQPRVPDILEFVPDSPADRCVRFCFDVMHLSIDQTSGVLYDATKIAQAIQLITDGKLTSSHISDDDELS